MSQINSFIFVATKSLEFHLLMYCGYRYTLVFLDVPSNVTVTMVCLGESALVSIRPLDHQTVK
jgi:hypothetical protein